MVEQCFREEEYKRSHRPCGIHTYMAHNFEQAATLLSPLKG